MAIYLTIILVFLLMRKETYCNGHESTLGHISNQVRKNDDLQITAVSDLIQRILGPENSKNFEVVVNSSFISNGKEQFSILSLENNKIRIVGTTGVGAASGFHYYLKYHCHCHISWETLQLNIPNPLPKVSITKTFNDRFRYYQNVCTTSYSFTWWDWNQWEKHIDWMVLNSFNLVLAFNGQESIWERVYKKFNLTEEEIKEHFSGPAFLAWQRMGNIRGWGGGLSKNWHDRSIVLQKQILTRLRSFGVITVLPAFAGHLPRAFKRLFPNTKMEKIGSWNNFNDTYCCPYFLDPTEELFNTIGKTFLQEQIAEFGTDHVYNCDSFNENRPESSDLDYLANVGKATYRAMTEVDPEAIWLMQNWLFVHDFFYWTRLRTKAILTSVPIGKMIILDLQSEQFPQYPRLESYFGQPYIWCMLHNFGGTLGMHGSSDIINSRVFEARNANGSTMIGTGLTPEGINQNYVIYDLMTEMAWRETPTNLTGWFKAYSIRRYGKSNQNATSAWNILQNTAYNFKGLDRIRGHTAMTLTPSLGIKTWNWYDSTDLHIALSNLVNATDNLKNNTGFVHDLVDVSRQCIQNILDGLYNHLIRAFKSPGNEKFLCYKDIFLTIFGKLNPILATNQAFSLQSWIESARNASNDPQEKDLFEYNARNQITLWGPRGEILNYAIKQWSDVANNFLLARWMVFLDYLTECKINGTKYDNTYIKKKIFNTVEEPFTFKKLAESNRKQEQESENNIEILVRALLLSLEEVPNKC